MTQYFSADGVTLYHGDCLEVMRGMAADSVQCVVTSPPYYGLRDYGVAGQIALEQTPAAYLARHVAGVAEVRRVLRQDGVVWLNLGDSYASGEIGRHDSVQGREIDGKPVTSKAGTRQQSKVDTGLAPKQLLGIPWRVAFALQADGWYLRSDCIWHKPNPMPESVTDRPTKAHEYVFLLSKSARYFYDAEAVKEDANPEYKSRYDYYFNVGEKEASGGGRVGAQSNTPGIKEYTGKRNGRTVWTIATRPYGGAHFATMPPELAQRCILSGSRPGNVVLDPFNGAGTTGMVAIQQGRGYVGIDLNAQYLDLTIERIDGILLQPRLFASGDESAILPKQERMFEEKEWGTLRGVVLRWKKVE